jgi:hypothetical protein
MTIIKPYLYNIKYTSVIYFFTSLQILQFLTIIAHCSVSHELKKAEKLHSSRTLKLVLDKQVLKKFFRYKILV